MIKKLLILMIGTIGIIICRLCIPVMFLLIACKLWYEPYSWGWVSTIIVPLSCGLCGVIVAAIARASLE